jgi:AcrR family transcriptional regulator
LRNINSISGFRLSSQGKNIPQHIIYRISNVKKSEFLDNNVRILYICTCIVYLFIIRMKQKLLDIAENEKLGQIVRASKDLFWKYGIKRVTIEEVCNFAGVSKMTFYKHFKNKIELVKVIIAQITDEATEKYKAIMAQDIPFPEKVRQSIQLKMEGTSDMSHEFFDDYFLHADPELKTFLSGKVQESLAMIHHDYVIAQLKGEIRKDVKPEFIMYFLNKIMEMTQDEQLESLYPNPQDLILEVVNFFFYGIMHRDNIDAGEKSSSK